MNLFTVIAYVKTAINSCLLKSVMEKMRRVILSSNCKVQNPPLGKLKGL